MNQSGSGHGKRSSAWILRPQRVTDPRAKLFCFPFAGSGASTFAGWSRELASEGIEVLGVQLPGRENRLRERRIANAMRIAATLCDELEEELGVPFLLYGHSMGGLLAFETAREMRRRSFPPAAALIVGASRPPHVPSPEPSIHRLSDKQFVNQLRDRFRSVTLNSLEDPEIRKIYQPILRSDFELMETYAFRSESPLDCPVIAIRGSEDPSLSAGEQERWRELSSGPFRMQTVAGDHFFVRTARQAVHEIIRREASLLAKPAAAGQ